MAIARIRKGDVAVVVSGTSAGMSGEVLSVDPRRGVAVVKGVNMRKKAVRRTEKAQGGIIAMEMPVRLCKLMPYDAEAKRGTRVRAGEKDGKKARVSVKSGKAL